MQTKHTQVALLLCENERLRQANKRLKQVNEAIEQKASFQQSQIQLLRQQTTSNKEDIESLQCQLRIAIQRNDSMTAQFRSTKRQLVEQQINCQCTQRDPPELIVLD